MRNVRREREWTTSMCMYVCEMIYTFWRVASWGLKRNFLWLVKSLGSRDRMLKPWLFVTRGRPASRFDISKIFFFFFFFLLTIAWSRFRGAFDVLRIVRAILTVSTTDFNLITPIVGNYFEHRLELYSIHYATATINRFHGLIEFAWNWRWLWWR